MSKNVIDQVREAMRKSGESQGSIERATGIAQGNLSKFIRGQRQLTLENFSKLCAHLGLSLRSK